MLRYLLAFTIPLSVYFSLISQGALTWTAFIYSFTILPLLELVLSSQVKPKEIANGSKLAFDVLLYLAPFIQIFLILVFLNEFASSSPLDQLAKILALGISCGVIGINIGHELGHRKSLFERLIAIFLLSTSIYSHFYIEHNKGHHRHVATPEDSATARLGENLYTFILRSMWGCLKGAYQLDVKVFGATQSFQLAMLGAIFLYSGPVGTMGFVAAALFGGINLEIVNYIEHYGLMRKKNPSGRYEKVTPLHSWNSNHPIGRSILFELTRHSDHHAYIDRPYYKLQNNLESPQLPAGYPAMMVLATVPPLFFKVMDPLAAKYNS